MLTYSPVLCHICGGHHNMQMIAVEVAGVRLFRCTNCAVHIHELIHGQTNFEQISLRLTSVFFSNVATNPRWRGDTIIDEYFNHVSRKAKCWPWNILDGEVTDATAAHR